MTDVQVDDLDIVRAGAARGDGPTRMLPAEAYTSEAVLAWERRHLFAGTWTCLGRLEELLPEGGRRPVTQRAAVVGDIGVLLVRTAAGVRMYANTCRHRGHEILPDGETTHRRSILCPYHAWSYDFDGALQAAKGFREGVDGFRAADFTLAELPVRVWQGWVFGHAAHAVDDPGVPAFDEHLGDLAQIVEPYDTGSLALADRHSYEVAANWKVVAENYHECYHCPLIHPELCTVTIPDSGDNYALPGAWVGGSMVLRDASTTMSMTGELAATPLPGVDQRKVEYVHLLPNLLISTHPDYVMTHRLVPQAPDRTWIECSWYVSPGDDGSVPAARGAVEFWDITNKQDWGACESVQRGLASPHFRPGPFAPNEDAVARLVTLLSRGYLGGSVVG